MNDETEPTIQELETAARVAETNTEKSEQILAAQKDPRARQLLLLDELETFAKRMLAAGGQLSNVEAMKTELLHLTTEVQTVVSDMTKENARLTQEACRSFNEDLAKIFEQHCKEQEDALVTMAQHVQQKIDEFVDYYAGELAKQALQRTKELEFLEIAKSVLQRYT